MKCPADLPTCQPEGSIFSYLFGCEPSLQPRKHFLSPSSLFPELSKLVSNYQRAKQHSPTSCGASLPPAPSREGWLRPATGRRRWKEASSHLLRTVRPRPFSSPSLAEHPICPLASAWSRRVTGSGLHSFRLNKQRHPLAAAARGLAVPTSQSRCGVLTLSSP